MFIRNVADCDRTLKLGNFNARVSSMYHWNKTDFNEVNVNGSKDC